MKIEVKRIIKTKYDEICDLATKDFFSNIEEIQKQVKNTSEFVEHNGKIIEVDINPEQYLCIIEEVNSRDINNPSAITDIELAKKLYEDFTIGNIDIPDYILYEKEVWTYLNICIFYEVICARFKDIKTCKSSEKEGKIKRLFFCKDSKIDRTGLRWLWVLGNLTIDNIYGESLLETAKEFIDPVKAIYECCLGRNKIVFKGFIRAIQLIENNNLIRSSKYKSLVPKHIRNSALMNVYESYFDIEELAQKISTDISLIIDLVD